jgi:hypothetical protein
LEEGGLLAVGEVADQGVVDGVDVDLHGAIGDGPALICQADDDGPAIVCGARSFDETALNKTGDEPAEGRLAEQDGFGEIMHAHVLTLMEPEVEQNVNVADRQTTVPAEFCSQTARHAVVGEAERLPGSSALVAGRLE